MRRLVTLLFAVALLVGPWTAGASRAAYPGNNGLLALSSDAPGKSTIATLDLSTGAIKYLTTPAQSPSVFGDQNPIWSPGGMLIVFSRYDAQGDGDIWRMNANGSGQKRLTTHGADDDYATISADGSRIAFASNRSGNYEIYTMRIDGTDVRRITNHAAEDIDPSWSPNNDRIAFSSDRRIGKNELYTMKPDGSGVARITTAAFGDYGPAWTADGTTLAYTKGLTVSDSAIWSVNVATKAALEVHNATGFQGDPAPVPFPGAAPVNAYFYVSEESGDVDVFRGSLDGGSISNITEDHDGFVLGPDMQPKPTFPLVDARFSTFRHDIEWVYAEGITSGCSPERYCPDDAVTRGQMASFLVRALGLSGTAVDAFTDDDGTTHERDIDLVAREGITGGCAPGKYCPDVLVSREQMASFLARALELTGPAVDAFTDDETSGHENDINRVAREGITSGCGGTNYCPKANVTRGQMAAFLRRAFEE